MTKFTESQALLKGIESESSGSCRWNHFFIEQPNTVPNAVTQEILEEKYQLLLRSYANYSFMMDNQ
jgi:dihydroorotase